LGLFFADAYLTKSLTLWVILFPKVGVRAPGSIRDDKTWPVIVSIVCFKYIS